MPRSLLAAAVGASVLLSAACHKGADASSIVTSGHVEATDVRLSAKVPGRIASFALQEGSPVAAGQELARVERFGHVIVGAPLQASHPIRALVARRKGGEGWRGAARASGSRSGDRYGSAHPAACPCHRAETVPCRRYRLRRH